MLLHCLLALTTTSAAAYQLAVAPLRTEQARQQRLLRRACPLFCEYAAGSAGSSDVHGAVDVGPERDVDRPALLDSSALLDALDHWLRRQSISTVLPKSQAKQLLRDLRDDQRFWAQQRRQFARAWVLFEAGLRAETRPVGTLLGKETSAKILSVAEEMETDPVLVNAVVRSEIVEAMLGYVLYNGIGQFMQQADLIGLALNNIPVLGPLRLQLMQMARSNVDALVGPQVERFLGGYSVAAAETAVAYVLAEENKPQFRRARSKLARKLLEKPICELVNVSDLEAAVVRDSVWSGVRQFKLPNEAALLDELYAEFGDEPMAILLPKDRVEKAGGPPKTAPLFDRGRSILRDIIAAFLASDDWEEWVESRGKGASGAPGVMGAEGDAAVCGAGAAAHPAVDAAPAVTAAEKMTAVAANGASRVDGGEGCGEGAADCGASSPDASSWDGWD